ncbi:MAG: type VI secretion system baseplate subunit TssG, partial [Gemmatimonadaceae bacterium]
MDAGGADAHDGDAALRALLRAEPWSFDFFKAVHLLERLHEDRAPVGGFADPAAEVVRFKAHTDPSFPASEIQALEAERVRRPGRASRAMTAADVEAGETHPEARPLEMTVNFMGLTGPQGVLPLAYSQHVAARVRVGDRALRDFLDIFNHRLVSLFYRGWLRSHLAASFEAARDGDPSASSGQVARDRITPRLHDLAGLGSAELEQRLAVPAQAVVFYAGLLAMQSRPAAALEQMLRDYF